MAYYSFSEHNSGVAPIVPIKAGAASLDALIDTGAQINVLPAEYRDKYGLIQTDSVLTIQDGAGRLEEVKKYKVRYNIQNNEIEMYCILTVHNVALIGLELLKHFNLSLHDGGFELTEVNNG